MSEELKEEVICLAHSSVECSKKNDYSFGIKRGCNLGVEHNDPFTSTCQWRHVIKAPSVPVETNPVPVPELPLNPTALDTPF